MGEVRRMARPRRQGGNRHLRWDSHPIRESDDGHSSRHLPRCCDRLPAAILDSIFRYCGKCRVRATESIEGGEKLGSLCRISLRFLPAKKPCLNSWLERYV